MPTPACSAPRCSHLRETDRHERQRARTNVRHVRAHAHVPDRTVVGANSLRYPVAVIWFFDRDGETLRYEISRDRREGRYRVIITHPDGSQSVEELDRPTELIERSAHLMNRLRGDGWHVA